MKINSIQTCAFRARPIKSKCDKQRKPAGVINPILSNEQVKLLYDALDCSRNLKKTIYDYKNGISKIGGNDIESMYLYCKHLNYTLEQITTEMESR